MPEAADKNRIASANVALWNCRDTDSDFSVSLDKSGPTGPTFAADCLNLTLTVIGGSTGTQFSRVESNCHSLTAVTAASLRSGSGESITWMSTGNPSTPILV